MSRFWNLHDFCSSTFTKLMRFKIQCNKNQNCYFHDYWAAFPLKIMSYQCRWFDGVLLKWLNSITHRIQVNIALIPSTPIMEKDDLMSVFLPGWNPPYWGDIEVGMSRVDFPCLNKILANERRRYLCNAFSHWLRPCSIWSSTWNSPRSVVHGRFCPLPLLWLCTYLLLWHSSLEELTLYGYIWLYFMCTEGGV